MKSGDTVRYINATGGGKVVRIEGQIAYVEEADGFVTPVLAKECVVIPTATATATAPAAPKASAPKPQTSKYDAPAPKAPPVAIETAGGNSINAMLAFEPHDIKALSTSDFDAFFVNDSNYWIYLVVASRSSLDNAWTPCYDGLIEPNMQEFLWELPQSGLASVDKLRIQLLAFKRGKEYEAKNPVCMELKFDATKFVRLHCFRPNRYFDSAVIAYDILRADSPAMQYAPDPAEISRQMRSKNDEGTQQTKPMSRSSKPSREPLVVDLHASELLESTAGLTSSDILNYQVDTFRRIMDANLRNIGQKIVFIHGKGEGVLRQALEKELSHRYKGQDVQDASFAEYGFGATQVTIRNTAAQHGPAKARKR